MLRNILNVDNGLKAVLSQSRVLLAAVKFLYIKFEKTVGLWWDNVSFDGTKVLFYLVSVYTKCVSRTVQEILALYFSNGARTVNSEG